MWCKQIDQKIPAFKILTFGIIIDVRFWIYAWNEFLDLLGIVSIIKEFLDRGLQCSAGISGFAWSCIPIHRILRPRFPVLCFDFFWSIVSKMCSWYLKLIKISGFVWCCIPNQRILKPRFSVLGLDFFWINCMAKKSC